MKVLWLSHFIPYPPKGGMLIRSYNLIKQLAQRHEVDLVALGRVDTMRGMFSSDETGFEAGRRELSRFCASVEFVPTKIGSSRLRTWLVALTSLLPGPPYSVRWFADAEFARTIDRRMSATAYDLIVFDTISLAQYLKTPETAALVLDHHNIESDMLTYRATRERSLLKKAYYFQESWRLRRYEKKKCNLFDSHLTCSEVDSSRLKEIEPSARAIEIPNGVDISFFEPGDGCQVRDSAIFVGGQNWYPNRDAMEFFASEVWPLVSERVPALEFDLVGRSPSRLVLNVASDDSRFRVHGFVDDIRKMIQEAKVYVCPIRDGGGTKLKILDALAMGKAIVAHPKAIEGIDLTPGVDVLLAETAEQFASQIERALADDAMRRSIEKAARHVAVTRYSYDKIGKKLCDHVEELKTKKC